MGISGGYRPETGTDTLSDFFGVLFSYLMSLLFIEISFGVWFLCWNSISYLLKRFCLSVSEFGGKIRVNSNKEVVLYVSSFPFII